MGTFDNRCRCDGSQMHGSDHCTECGCEEFEERCDWPENLPWQERSDGAKWAQALRRGR
jgi:hypothetical protein